MRKYVFMLLLLLAGYLSCLSQQYISLLNADSLKKVLLTATDTQRLNTLNLLSRHLIYSEEKDHLANAKTYNQEALKLAKSLPDPKGRGGAMLNEGILAIMTGGDYSATLKLLLNSLALLKSAGDQFSIACCYDWSANCFHLVGDNPTAIVYFDSSQHLYKQLGDTVTAAWTMTGEAHSHYDLGDYTSAYRTLHEAEGMTPVSDTLLLSYLYCNMAKLFLAANMPETCLEYTNKVRHLHPTYNSGPHRNLPGRLHWAWQITAEAYLEMNKVDSALKIAQALGSENNLLYGRLYQALHQYDTALVYLKRGYTESQQSTHRMYVARFANELASAYGALGKYETAIQSAREGISVARKIHAALEERNGVGILADLYRKMKNYKKAHEYDQLYKKLNDSFAPNEYRRKISLLQVQHELELQKQQAQLLASEKLLNLEQIQNQRTELNKKSIFLWAAVATLVALGIVLLLVRRNLVLRKRKEGLQRLMTETNEQLEQTKKEHLLAELQSQKTELEMQVLRAQMNPHFIFNCLSSINRYILINRTEEASDYLTKFSRLMRMALHHSEKSLITLEDELETLRLYLDLERLRFKNAFNYSITFINSVDSALVYIPPLLIQPFAENAIWHGLMHKQGPGYLDIELSMVKEVLTCVITDNGIGRTKAAYLNHNKTGTRNKGMGVQITVDRLALFNRTGNDKSVFDIEDITDEAGNPGGTRVTLNIKYQDVTKTPELQHQ